MDDILKWFWNEKFWLPDGYSWKDLEPTPGVNKPNFKDLYYSPILAAFILVIRYIFENYLAKPFCCYIGIPQENRKDVEENEVFETFFTTVTKHPNQDQIKENAKKSGCSTLSVEKWFQKRRKLGGLSLMRKATESCWRCTIYFCLFMLGCATLLPNRWFYDSDEWVKGYMRTQDFNIFFKTYYLTELAFYLSLLCSQFVDAKRKDFWQMFIHHIVTISLILCSFVTNYHRTATVIMWLHDASDIWLEAAKVFNYAKWQRVCDGLFVVFALAFFATRLVYFPFVVLRAFVIRTPQILGPCNGMHTFLSGKLLVLQCLHIFWWYLISRMVYELTVKGKVSSDTRSDNESSQDEAEEGDNKKED